MQPECEAAREADVNNLSLARIMYGSNEEHRSSDWTSAPALRSQGLMPAPVTVENSSPNHAYSSLEGLLHRAWLAIHPKQ